MAQFCDLSYVNYAVFLSR